MKAVLCLALASLVACRATTCSPDVATARTVTDGPVVLHDGANSVDLLGDGTPAQVFVAWRGNFNAHGYSTVAIYLRAPSDRDTVPAWQIVPRFGGPGVAETGREIVETFEGADCTRGDLRLVQRRGAPADLVLARRELGASFADSAATHFDYYRLTRNEESVPGWPPYYYAFVRTVDAHRQYCDVNVAFEQELHLGRRGVGRGEASQ